MSNAWSNWSGNVSCVPVSIEKPSSEEQLSTLLRESNREVRVAGTGHSFTPLCATDGMLLSLENMHGILATDSQSCEATIWAGTPISQIGAPLLAVGLALQNQGDIDKQSLAGAIATGTHGTGLSLGNLSSQVTALRLVLATGEVLTCSETVEPEIFKAAQVSLGMLGLVSQITVKALPAYRLHERTWASDVETCFAQLDSLVQTHRHCEFFWLPRYNQCAMKTLHPTEEEPRGQPTDPFAAPGTIERYALSERVDWSYRVFPSERNARFNEMEFSIALQDGPSCFEEIRQLMRTKYPDIIWPIEYRTVAADDSYLSPAFGRSSVAISVHQSYKLPYEAFFADVEAIFRNYHGRPHWGKIHWHTARDLQDLYPMWQQFHEIRQRLDPAGRFMNAYLRHIMTP